MNSKTESLSPNNSYDILVFNGSAATDDFDDAMAIRHLGNNKDKKKKKNKNKNKKKKNDDDDDDDDHVKKESPTLVSNVHEKVTEPTVPEKAMHDDNGVIKKVDPAMMNPTIQPSLNSTDSSIGGGWISFIVLLCLVICFGIYMKFFHSVKSAAHEQTVAKEERKSLYLDDINGDGDCDGDDDNESIEDGFHDEVKEDLIGSKASRWASKIENLE